MTYDTELWGPMTEEQRDAHKERHKINGSWGGMLDYDLYALYLIWENADGETPEHIERALGTLFFHINLTDRSGNWLAVNKDPDADEEDGEDE